MLLWCCCDARHFQYRYACKWNENIQLNVPCFHFKFTHKYRISSNKHPRRFFNVEALRGAALKEGGMTFPISLYARGIKNPATLKAELRNTSVPVGGNSPHWY